MRGFSRLVAKLCDGERFQWAVTLSLMQQGGGQQTLSVQAKKQAGHALYTTLSHPTETERGQFSVRRGGRVASYTSPIPNLVVGAAVKAPVQCPHDGYDVIPCCVLFDPLRSNREAESG